LDALNATLSPDGRYLTTADNRDDVKLWDLRDPARPRIAIDDLTADSRRFSRDGRTLMLAADGVVRFWDLSAEAGPRLLPWELPGYGPVFGPDGSILSTDLHDGTVQLWDLTGAQGPVAVGAPIQGTYAQSFSADGTKLAVQTGESDEEGTTVQVWDVSEPGRPAVWGLPVTGGDPVFAGARMMVTVSPQDTRTFWGERDRQWRRVDLGAGQEDTVEYGPGTALVVVGQAGTGTTSVWDVSEPAQPLRVRAALVGMPVGFADGERTLATATAAGTVILWDAARPTEIRRGPLVDDGGTLIGGADAALFTETTLPGPGNFPIADLARVGEPAGRQGAMIDVTVLAAADGDTLTTVPLAGAGLDRTAVSLDPDGKVLAALTLSGGNLLRWDVSEPGRPRQLRGSFGPDVRNFAVSNDGTMIATASPYGDESWGVVLWDTSDADHPQRLTRTPLTGLTEGFSPNGDLLVTRNGSTIHLWDLHDQHHPGEIVQSRLTGQDWRFSADGTVLAVVGAAPGDEDEISLWDVADVQQVRPLRHPAIPGDVAEFSPDGRTLVVSRQADGGRVQLWDIAERTNIHQIAHPPIPGTFSQFTRDGQTMIVTSAGVQLWDLTDVDRPALLEGPPGIGSEVVRIGASDVYAFKWGDLITFWDLSGLHRVRADAVRTACARAGGAGLSRQEWAQYVPGLDYVDACR